MFLARATGSMVATLKVASIMGHKLLTVEPYRVGPLGAGLDELVLICQGSSARLTSEAERLPVDAVVIKRLDSVDVGGKVILSTRKCFYTLRGHE